MSNRAQEGAGCLGRGLLFIVWALGTLIIAGALVAGFGVVGNELWTFVILVATVVLSVFLWNKLPKNWT